MAEKDIKFFVRILPKVKTKTDVTHIIHSEKVKWSSVLHFCSQIVFTFLSNTANDSSQEVKLVVPEASRRQRYRTFQIDGVFTDHCQSDVFSTIIDESAFENVTRGSCLVVIALGEPISGKTYTMMGIKDMYQFRGLIPRFLQKIYSHPRTSAYKIAVSFIQFLNDKCTDLLSGRIFKSEFYKAIKPTEVKSETVALDLLFSGEKKRSRKQGASCGSAVFSIFIYIPTTVVKRSSVSQVHLVDAAGLWNASRTETCIAPLKNLHSWRWPFTLRKAVFNHIDKEDAPYKLVPMIGFLREAISMGKIRLIAHVKDDVQHWRYNKWTLAFCNELSKKGRATTAVLDDPPYVLRTMDLYNEIQELRDYRDYGQTSDDIVFVPFRSDDSRNDYSEVIKSFFNNETTENDLLTVAHPTILLLAMKQYYDRALDVTRKDTTTTKSRKSLKSEHRDSLAIQYSRKTMPFVHPPEKAPERINREPTNDPQENWKIFWEEFLDRYPEKRRELSAAIEELQLARKEKELKQEMLNSIKGKAIESEKESLRTLWKRSLKGGDEESPQPKTRQAQLEEEMQIIASGKKFDGQVWEAENEFAFEHKNYLKKLMIFNNISYGMNALFMDYILTTYDCNLSLPETINYEESLPPVRQETRHVSVEYGLEEKAYDLLKQRHLFKKTYTTSSDNKQLFKYTKTKRLRD